MKLVIWNVSDAFEDIPISFKFMELIRSHICTKLEKFSFCCFYECLLIGQLVGGVGGGGGGGVVGG